MVGWSVGLVGATAGIYSLVKVRNSSVDIRCIIQLFYQGKPPA